MKKALTKILFGLLSLGLVLGTLALDEMSKASAGEGGNDPVAVVEKGPKGTMEKNQENYVIKSGEDARLVFTVFENSVFRLAPKSEIQLTISEKGGEPSVDIELKSGRLWINTFASGLTTTLAVPFASLKADAGVSEVSLKPGQLTAKAFRRSMTVELLGKHLILPEGNAMELRESKILTNKIDIPKLWYSKLSKEFPYEPIGDLDDWEIQNSEEDVAFWSAVKENFAEKVRDRGPVLSSDEEGAFFKLHDAVKRTNLLLVIDEQKKEILRSAHAMEYLDSAAYALLVGDDKTADGRLQQFRDRLSSLEKNEDWRHSLAARYRAVSFAVPGDPFYREKETLRGAINFAPISRMHESFIDVMDSAASGTDEDSLQAALAALRKYGATVNASVEKLREPELADEIFFEIVMVHELLAKSPKFMKEEFLKIPALLQKAHIRLLNSTVAANDSRQFLISEKLKFIALISEHLEKGSTPFQEGRRSILALADEIEAMKPEFADSAVLAYYTEQVEKLRPMLSYLRASGPGSDEGDFTENLEAFTKRQDEFRKVNELLADAEGGEEISASRREELAGIVSEDIGGVGVTDIKIILPSADGDARVKVVSASFEGIPFSATYDTEKKIISNLVMNEEEVPNAVRLQNFSKFFLIKIGKLSLPAGESEESLVEVTSEASVLERVAKTRLLEYLERLEIIVEDKYLGFEDFKDGLIHVRLATIGKGADAKVFSFDYAQSEKEVRSLKVQTVAGEISVNDTFTLRELPIKVVQIYQRAVFEQEKEEELENEAE